MVDQEPKPYRPRRAFVESVPDQDTAAAEALSEGGTPAPGGGEAGRAADGGDAGPAADGGHTGPAGEVVADEQADPTEPGPDRADPAEPGPDQAGPEQAGPEQATPEQAGRAGPPPAGAADDRPGLDPDEEDEFRPLYRDEVSDRATRPVAEDPAEHTITFTRRPPAAPDDLDDGATTVLPRSRGGRRPPTDPDDLDEFGEDEHRPIGRRTRLALLVGAVAAIVVIGIAVGYAVLGVGKPGPGVGTSTGSGGSEPGSSTPAEPGASAVLSEASMLSPEQAKALDAKRTWSVSLSQRGDSADAPDPACFSPDGSDGEPPAQQRILQVLASTGKNAPTALHQADAYGSPEEAAQAFAVASKTLGGCPVPGSYVRSGRVVTGLGDQAVGVVAVVRNAGKDQAHSLLVNRTGRVLNVLDVTQPVGEADLTAVAKALAAVVGGQCTPAGGTCDAQPVVRPGPPPLGGDTPGFLAYGDLPPAGPKPASWVATPVEPPKEDFVGSGCEAVNWSTVPAVDRSSRVYLVQDSGKSLFGLNEIVLTEKDDAAAAKLVDKVRGDLASCKKRKLTATVSKPAKVSGVGARNVAVSGWTSTVTQKAGSSSVTYRVGMVKAGSKVVYVFLTPEDDFDISPAKFAVVAARAGERVTQVN